MRENLCNQYFLWSSLLRINCRPFLWVCFFMFQLTRQINLLPPLKITQLRPWIARKQRCSSARLWGLVESHQTTLLLQFFIIHSHTPCSFVVCRWSMGVLEVRVWKTKLRRSFAIFFHRVSVKYLFLNFFFTLLFFSNLKQGFEPDLTRLRLRRF